MWIVTVTVGEPAGVHVLVAAHDYHPDPGAGGTGRYVAETATRLVDRGHDVSVVTRRRGDVPGFETRDGVAIRRYDVEVAGRHGLAVLAQLPGALGAVGASVERARGRAGVPDVVSLQGPLTGALVSRSVGGDVPRVVTLHSPWPTEYRLKTRAGGPSEPRRRVNVAVRRTVERGVLAASDLLVTLSDYMRDRVDAVYDHSLPTAVVPGGVDPERFVPDGAELSGVDGEPAFLTVRRLSERMGHDALLEGFAAVLEDAPDARLFVAGDSRVEVVVEVVERGSVIVNRVTS